MNDARRKELNKARGLIEEAQSLIQTARDDEQEAFDNLSESLQGGEKGEKMSTAIDELQQADDRCDEIIANIEAAGD